jgi:hypothetical protein
MRLVYLDEAGIGDIVREPRLIVTGAIIDADRQWKELEAYYRALAQDIFPNEPLDRFVFHAKDVFHGAGYFRREKFSRHDRMRILKRLAQVPAIFSIPIAVTAIDRAKLREELLGAGRNLSANGNPEKSVRVLSHSMAFVRTVHKVDYWMRRHAAPNEVAMLIAEDTAQVKEAFGMLHQAYTYRTYVEDVEDELQFRAESIVDNVHFATKSQSILLQIADHAAFIVGGGCPTIPMLPSCTI